MDKRRGKIKNMKKVFKFLNPGKLIDNDLELVLTKKIPEDTEKGYFPAYKFEMRNSKTEERMGDITLRVGNNENTKYGGHVGYGVDEKFRGHHYAARSVKLLLSLAKKHSINPLWITCNPDNTASIKSLEIAGGEMVEIVDLPKHNEQYQRGERKKCRYKFDL